MRRRGSGRAAADLVVSLGFVAWLHQPAPVPVSFAGIPADATSVTMIEWRGDFPPRSEPRQSMNTRGSVTLVHQPGASLVVLFSRSDGAYIADGPFTWPDDETTRTVDRQWRRTIESAGNAVPRRMLLDWISASPSVGPWPRCAWDSDTAWRCWGVPLGASGIVAGEDAGRTYWAVVSTTSGAAPVLQPSAWGRLIRGRGASADEVREIEVRALRPVAPPPHRLKSIRLEIADVRGTQRLRVPPDAIWIAADESPAGAWIDVRAGDLGPVIVPFADLAAAPGTVPFDVALSPPAAISGVIVGADDAPVPGALISLFRLIDPPETPATVARGEPRARRIPAGDLITGADGRFAFERLPEGDFELLAWHGQLGRASLLVRSGADSATLRLAPAAVARGRVLIHGSPAPDIPIVSVPDPAAIGAVDDMTELKGGDGRSGPDGRFLVAVAPRGGGELRIGGGATAARRVPLPTGPPVSSVDIGDIDLPGARVVSFVLDRDPGCDLVAVGPLAHAGLQIITATRTRPGMFEAALPEEGTWRVALSCGQVERPVAPALVKVSDATRTVNLRVQ